MRKLDIQGRIVIPKSLLDAFGWDAGTEFEIYTDGRDKVILREHREGCALCGSKGDTVHHKRSGKRICEECLSELK